MKKLTLALIIILGFISCEPNPATEEINLPPMQFGLQISPDTAYIRLGDTITLKGSIPSTLSNGVKIEDGQAKIDLFIGYINQIPITTFTFEAAKPNDHLNVYPLLGGINISSSTGKVTDIYALPYGDSIQVEIAFVPQKLGTYTFYIQSQIYKGSKGKTRTQPFYLNPNHHFDELWRIPSNDYNYSQQYLFAVTN